MEAEIVQVSGDSQAFASSRFRLSIGYGSLRDGYQGKEKPGKHSAFFLAVPVRNWKSPKYTAVYLMVHVFRGFAGGSGAQPKLPEADCHFGQFHRV